MNSIFLKTQIFIILLTSACNAMAQPINDRWHGSWYAGKDSLTIDASNFNGCRWVISPDRVNHDSCVAYYSSNITRSEMLRKLQAVIKLNKDSQLSVEDLKEFDADTKLVRETLAGVSNETFKTVRTFDSRAAESGDCDGFYFLDQKSIYMLWWCIRESSSIYIRRYTKR